RGPKAMALALVLVVLLAAVAAAREAHGYVAYNTSAGTVAGLLNVHLVPHSHDDVGWLKTVDQYYVGSNNSIQGACVMNTLDSVVDALARDPGRKFVVAEQVTCSPQFPIEFSSPLLWTFLPFN
uniref:Glycoside hydrolase family 38 N-terminal domain-containing protein n=1 Tax=Aegilops tauschii subsp. strangulata TaxID=200361 RepID=A0A452XFA9_AEGTS